MKKILFIILIMAIIFLNKNEENVLIPDEAIRFRVVANSNSVFDQTMKKVVQEDIQKKLSDILIDVDNVSEANQKIEENLEIIDNSVEKILLNNNYNLSYDINYGMNYFPEKLYNGIKYESGEYKSLVVTLGNGLGNNWWCVMFPPLCLLEAEETEKDEVEYKFFIQKIIDKFF